MINFDIPRIQMPQYVVSERDIYFAKLNTLIKNKFDRRQVPLTFLGMGHLHGTGPLIKASTTVLL